MIEDPPYEMLKRIEDIGVAKEKLSFALKTELFDNLSKHNEYWQSEDEMMSEKLNQIRLLLSFLYDELWDVYHVLNDEENG